MHYRNIEKKDYYIIRQLSAHLMLSLLSDIPHRFMLSSLFDQFTRLVTDGAGSSTHSCVSLSGGELIDPSGLELPGGDSVLEEDIKFTVRSSLGFGESEVGPDETTETSSSPEVTGFRTPVPSGRVEHVRVENTDDDTTQVVQVSSKDDSLGSESSRSNLSDERVTDGTDGKVVDECEDDQESTDGPSSRVGGLNCAENTGEDHDDDKDALSVEVNVSSSGVFHDDPAQGGLDSQQKPCWKKESMLTPTPPTTNMIKLRVEATLASIPADSKK